MGGEPVSELVYIARASTSFLISTNTRENYRRRTCVSTPEDKGESVLYSIASCAQLKKFIRLITICKALLPGQTYETKHGENTEGIIAHFEHRCDKGAAAEGWQGEGRESEEERERGGRYL